MSSPITILNVDDSEAARYTRSHVLRRAGFLVVEASTGEEALRALHERAPQLVLLDVRLPDVSGIEICRTIKRDPTRNRTPVVQISSTYVSEQDQLAGLDGGAEVYLAEPVEPRELITVVRTLVRLRSAEKELRESEARWRRLFGASVIGVMVMRAGRITEANPALLRLLGASPAQLEAQALELEALTHPGFRAAHTRALAELAASGSCETFESALLHASGREVRVLISGTALDGEPSRWLGLVLDISERRRAEAEREQLLVSEQRARLEAQRAAQLKDEFLANLSHELRTPMSTISAWLHLLRDENVSKQQLGRGLDAIERATRAQNQLIADLLDVSRIIAGKLSVEHEPVELRGLLEGVAENFALDLAAKQLRLELELGAVRECTVLGDLGRLQQVFSNLLSNAVKFTPRGGRIWIRASAQAEHAVVAVGDNGQGIPAHFLPHVFDRFRQADGSSMRKHGGMGLGLAIVRHLVDLHGGEVHATSAGPGQGSCFTVRLSCGKSGVRCAPAPSADSGVRETPLAGIRILLVEDDPDGREAIRELLERCGAECRAAASALEALALLDAWRPDVAISDIGMSGIDGYGFIRQLRRRCAERRTPLPALAVTAFAREEDRQRALESGYDGHIAKPIDLRELVAALLALYSRGSAHSH
jgi:PAS domain S-box-containing protein